MSLSLVQTGVQPKPFRMLIHGTEGIGKSTFAGHAPKPIFIQTEDGLDQIDAPKFPLCETYNEVLTCLQSLLHEPHDYMTVVLDSVDWFEKLAVHKVLEVFQGKTSIADIDYGKGYAMLIPLFEELIKLLGELRTRKSMNIILIAHTKMEKVEDPSGSSYDQYAPRLDKRINGIVKEWQDVIAFATHAIRKEEKNEGFGNTRTVVKTVKKDGNDRVLFLESSPAIVAKSRYRLPSEMPLDGKKFFYALYNLIYKKDKK